jgi:hypothetical protein
MQHNDSRKGSCCVSWGIVMSLEPAILSIQRAGLSHAIVCNFECSEQTMGTQVLCVVVAVG